MKSDSYKSKPAQSVSEKKTDTRPSRTKEISISFSDLVIKHKLPKTTAAALAAVVTTENGLIKPSVFEQKLKKMLKAPAGR